MIAMKYRIFDVKRKVYLDKNLYYVGQDGIIYKKSMPLPVRATNQENYEVRIVANDTEGILELSRKDSSTL